MVVILMICRQHSLFLFLFTGYKGIGSIVCYLRADTGQAWSSRELFCAIVGHHSMVGSNCSNITIPGIHPHSGDSLILPMSFWKNTIFRGTSYNLCIDRYLYIYIVYIYNIRSLASLWPLTMIIIVIIIHIIASSCSSLSPSWLSSPSSHQLKTVVIHYSFVWSFKINGLICTLSNIDFLKTVRLDWSMIAPDLWENTSHHMVTTVCQMPERHWVGQSSPCRKNITSVEENARHCTSSIIYYIIQYLIFAVFNIDISCWCT